VAEVDRQTPGAIAVIIPVRNEAAFLPRLISSLRTSVAQCGAAHPELTVSVTFCLDRCSDESAAIIEDSGYTAIHSKRDGVGAARQAAARHVLDHRRIHGLGRLWLANTDADSVVPPNWLTHQLDLAAAGADLVVGTVRPFADDLDEDRRIAWELTHDRGQASGHVHGANLGVRASTYLQAGGFDALDEHEDIDLARRVDAAGGRTVATDRHTVLTSGRLVGRTNGGYAGYLRDQLLPLAEAAVRPLTSSLGGSAE
jgi:glycosyltransferase involved in cell wall biosynthesis